MEQFLTIFALIIGWSLNEFSHIYRATKSHKQSIACALSILLEVRFQTIYFDHFIAVLKEKGISTQAIQDLHNLIDQTEILTDDLSEKYEEALDIISKNAPLVAYEYRTKAYFPKFIKKIRKLAAEQGASPQEVEIEVSKLTNMFIPRMNELVVDLAALHSKKLKNKTKVIISRKIEIPDEIHQRLTAQ